MTITIAQQDYHDLFDASQVNQSKQAESFEMVSPYPERLGQGYFRSIELREGIEVRIDRYQLHDDVVICLPERSHPVGYEFYLPTGCGSASQYFLCGSGTALIETWQKPAGQAVVNVNVHLEPSIVQAYLGESYNLKTAGLAHLIQFEQLYYQRAGTPTVAMLTTLHQLLNCPFAGVTKKMYLESKVWELMALLIDQELKLAKDQQSLPTLKADDVERIHHAKDILLQNYSSPPSLLNLARQVGLNDCTLKRGFRQVFGKTAFGYLHDYRIEKARQFLQEGNLNVTEAAHSVGFANRSYFAAAFRKKYGVSPKYYLR